MKKEEKKRIENKWMIIVVVSTLLMSILIPIVLSSRESVNGVKTSEGWTTEKIKVGNSFGGSITFGKLFGVIKSGGQYSRWTAVLRMYPGENLFYIPHGCRFYFRGIEFKIDYIVCGWNDEIEVSISWR